MKSCNRSDCVYGSVRPLPAPASSGGNTGVIAVGVAVAIVIVFLLFIAVVCVTKKPASVYALLTACRGKSDKQYRKLNFDAGGAAAHKDTTSFFEDGERARVCVHVCA
jgi:hypothetical protein